MAAGPRDDILTNMAYYRNGFINVFIAPSKLQRVCALCVRMCMRGCVYVKMYVLKCDRASLCVCVHACVCVSPLARRIARTGE